MVSCKFYLSEEILFDLFFIFILIRRNGENDIDTVFRALLLHRQGHKSSYHVKNKIDSTNVSICVRIDSNTPIFSSNSKAR